MQFPAFTDRSRRLRRIAQGAPHGRLEIISDSFDPANLCRPEAVNSLLETFLSEVNGDLDR